MHSDAKTVAEYIAEVPIERRAVIRRIRSAIKKNLPRGFREQMLYGMIGYVVPHSLYPTGYYCDPDLPLPFMNLANQKHYISLYHMGLYDGPLLEWFQEQWAMVTDQRLDMGKCCIRFKKIDKIPIKLIGELAGKITVDQWLETYEEAAKR